MAPERPEPAVGLQQVPAATLPVPAGSWEVPPSDARSPHALPWDWWDFLAVSLLWIAVTLVTGPVALALLGDPSGPIDPRYVIASNAQIVLALLLWAAARSREIGVLRGWRLLLGPKQVSWNDVAWGVLHGVVVWVGVTFVLGWAVEQLITVLGREVPPVQEQLQEVVREGRMPLVTGLATILVAPLVEELMFRGVLLYGLYRRLPAWPAAAISGLVFGLYHGEILAVVLLTAMGVYLARVVQRRGSLVPAIVAHMIFNAGGVVFLRSGLGA